MGEYEIVSIHVCLHWGGWQSPLHEECPKHHGHKGDPGVTPTICRVVGKMAQVILLWMRAWALGTHPTYKDLESQRVRP